MFCGGLKKKDSNNPNGGLWWFSIGNLVAVLGKILRLK